MLEPILITERVYHGCPIRLNLANSFVCTSDLKPFAKQSFADWLWSSDGQFSLDQLRQNEATKETAAVAILTSDTPSGERHDSDIWAHPQLAFDYASLQSLELGNFVKTWLELVLKEYYA